MSSTAKTSSAIITARGRRNRVDDDPRCLQGRTLREVAEIGREDLRHDLLPVPDADPDRDDSPAAVRLSGGFHLVDEGLSDAQLVHSLERSFVG